ncbi:sulfatase [Paenibacillus sp. 1P07SE]|uniref:sulfatase family protein n=1 Tax=Paenibacillus sp. 1P07SE TaxID=3132209 RepID=UPI0039A76C4C
MSTNQPLNLLMIITDQQRADSIQAYGNPLVHTPHLDRLAASGIRYDRAYCESPECCPARSMIFSGQWGHQTGNLGNGFVRKLDATLADKLNEAGYWTEYAGKMHAYPKENTWGFQKVHRSEECWPPEEDDFAKYIADQGLDWVYEPSGIRHEYYYVPQASQVPDRHHNTTWVGNRTVEFLEHASAEQPWCFVASFIKPHPPFDPTTPYLNLYDPADMPLPVRTAADRDGMWPLQQAQNYAKWTEQTDDNMARLIKAAYYASVTQIDTQIGRILDRLEEQGLRENTLILFVSDHGEMLGDHYQWGKRSYYNGSSRIPFLLSCPGRLPEGVVSEDLIGHRDIAPTLLDAAGLTINPEAWAGDSLLPRATGRTDYPWREVTFGELMTDTYHLMESGEREKLASIYMVADRRWKYIYSPNGGTEHLFDLDQDPDELNSLHHEPAAADVKQRLRSELVQFYRSVGFSPALNEAGTDLQRVPLTEVPTMRNRQYSPYDPHHLERRSGRN